MVCDKTTRLFCAILLDISIEGLYGVVIICWSYSADRLDCSSALMIRM